MTLSVSHATDELTLKRVHDFAVSIFGPLPEQHTFEAYREQLGIAPRLMVYVEENDVVVGCGLASIEADHVLVGLLAVDEDHRHQGLGKAMMDEIEKQTGETGRHTLILAAREDAEPFYLACGYQPHLFVQYPEAGYLPQLRALNRTYDIAWEGQDGGWSRLMLRTPAIDKTLQHAYESQFPNCATQTVFIKQV
jgi:GNAT superfamily N-acetyltransferase